MKTTTMRTPLLAAAAIGSVGFTVLVLFSDQPGSAAAPVPATHIRAGQPAVGWSRDMKQAMATAAADERSILLYFADPDPSPEVSASERALFSAQFVDQVSKQFVLVCFTGSDHSPAGLTSRALWADRLGLNEVPALVLLDEKGQGVASVGLKATGVDDLVIACQKMADTRTRRDAAFASAAAASGLEKATYLDRALSIVGDLAQDAYLPEMSEIMQLDSANAAGLRARYLEPVARAKIDHVLQTQVYPEIDQGHYDAAIDRISKLIQDQPATPAQIQTLITFQAQLYQTKGDIPRALAELDRALAMDSSSTAVTRIRSAREALVRSAEIQPGP